MNINDVVSVFIGGQDVVAIYIGEWQVYLLEENNE